MPLVIQVNFWCILFSCRFRIRILRVVAESMLPAAALTLATLSNHFVRNSTACAWHSYSRAHALCTLPFASSLFAAAASSNVLSLRRAITSALEVIRISLRFDDRTDFQNSTSLPARDNAGDLACPCCFCLTVRLDAAFMDSIISLSNSL